SDEEWSVMANLRDERGSSPAANDTIGSPLFPWGVEWPPPPDSGNFESVSISGYSENVPYTAAVGTFQKGANGLFDLAGNVSEWVGDFWTPGSEDRVARGGSFFDYERTALLASRRMRIEGGVARGNIGFRCVLVTADR
ncbi:MAG: SUMF1/EgtB/PvdO family nonheme iron enzyme, partial [Verrucomicrobiales bacterium]|nr:SUMF1/EgtB/PvdO family nonheme iron enzyme [Verrucomicrobiales bacterium]